MKLPGFYAAIAAVLWSHAVGAQLVQQGGKLVGNDATGAAWQASAVAVSRDGNTAIVGGYLDNAGAGAAWVFTRVNGVWSQQGAKLVGTGAKGNAQQGWSVAISGDGNTALVGAPADNSSVGAAWVFVRSGGAWAQQGSKLVGSGVSGHAAQGWAVALSADGNTALIGGPYDNTNAGAAWVFVRSGSAWKQSKKLVVTGAAGKAQAGASVAVSGDGTTAVVGGPQDNNGAGAAWVFTQSSGNWSQQGTKLLGLTPNTTFTIASNASVTATFTQQAEPCKTFSVSGAPNNGGTVSVSTQRNCSGGYLRGTEITVTAVPATGWTFSGWSDSGGVLAPGVSTLDATFTITDNAKITANYVEQSATCQTLAVAANPTGAGTATVVTGQTCLTGFTRGTPVVLVAAPAPGWVFTGWTGAAGVFSNPSSAISTFVVTGNATATANFAPPPTTCDTFAIGAGPAGAGTAVVNTAQNCPGGYVEGTRISLTANPAPGWVLSLWSGSGGSFSTTIGTVEKALQGSSVALSADGNTAVVGGSLDAYPQGAIWVFTRSGTTWTQQGNPLAVAGESGVAHVLWAVSISADGNTVLASEPGDEGGRGAAWVFVRSGGVWTQQGGKLVGAGAVGNAAQGSAAAISGDGSTVVIGGPNDSAGSGAAWVFAAGSPSPECAFSLTPAALAFPAAGGRGTVAVNAPSGSTCPWVAVEDIPWLAVGGSGGGSGSGSFTFAVSANPGAARSGTITVAGQTLTVDQAASSCSFTLDPASATLPESGGSGTFTVGTTAECPWSATTAAAWVHVASSEAVFGGGSVSFAVDANGGPARSATISVGDQLFTVNQAAHVSIPQALFSFAPASAVAGEVVQFSDLSAGAPASWSWSFGDGAASTAQNPTHTYAAAGTYAVTLTVANAAGQSTASQQVTVGSGVAAWVPVVSRSGGLGGSAWRSDAALLNPGGVPATVQGLFHGPDGVVVGNVVVPAGAQALVTDVVGQLGAQGSGALEIVSDAPVVVSSRTYDALAAGTVGQGYAAYGAAACLGTGATAWLPQLAEDAAYRTNISLTNTGTDPAVVAVTLLDGSGAVLGSYDVTLGPGEWAQENRPFYGKAGQTAVANGYAEVTVTSGSGVIASASVIDNATGDPTTVAMVPAPAVP